MQSTFLAIKASFPLIAKANSQARSERYNGVYPSMLHNTNLHRLLLITIKRATMCMNQQRIKRRDMRVDGLVIELHATSIQYKNLNMPNHSLSCKFIQHQKINCQ